MWEQFCYEFFSGVAKGIISSLINAAGDERQRWRDSHNQLSREIIEHTKKVQDILDRNLDYYDYRELIDLHYHSFSAADQAKLLLDDARLSFAAIGRAIVTAREQRDDLKKEIKNLPLNEKKQKQAEIDSLIQFRKALFLDKDVIKEQRDALLSELRKLNAQTHKLKNTIRDHTGPRGEMWYDRLQQRIHGEVQDTDTTVSIKIGGFTIEF